MQKFEIYHKLRLNHPKQFDKMVFDEFNKPLFKSKYKIDLLKKNLSILKKISKKFKNFNIKHPLRVSFYSIIFFKKNLDLITLSMFHNLFEIENIEKKKYKKIIDSEIIKNIEKLTIDKSRKFEKVYIKKYYKNLLESSKMAQIVKCLDKFDNLYNLNRNPDISIKKKYLAEIKKYIMPIIKDNKKFYKYLNLMIKFNNYQIKNG
jgi:hypothetical protein